MADALTFDKQQGYSQAEVAFIQRIVGSEPDGLWGPATVTAIEQWQTRQGIPADGKVWRSTSGNTWPRLLQAGADAWWTGSPGIARVGQWTFHTAFQEGSSAATAALRKATTAGLTDVLFTISNDSNHEFRLLGSVDDLVEVGKAYKDAGIDVGVNAFVFPSEAYVDALADLVLAVDARLGLRRLDIDAEELWIEHGTQADKDSAAARLGERLRGARFAVGVNGIVYTNRSALDPLVRQDCVTHVTPQAYSVAGKTTDGKPNGTYDPIDLQTRAARMWGEWWPDRTMIGGFATYDQAGRYELGTLTEQQAIGTALRTWADLGVGEVCGWALEESSDAAVGLFGQRPR